MGITQERMQQKGMVAKVSKEYEDLSKAVEEKLDGMATTTEPCNEDTDACEAKAMAKATWDFYKNKKGASGFVTHEPHFKDYRDWLVMCNVIGNENTAQFFVCEGCLGIFVHEQPFRCGQCDNWSEFKFKEITGEMRAELMAGRTMANIIKSYSYT